MTIASVSRDGWGSSYPLDPENPVTQKSQGTQGTPPGDVGNGPARLSSGALD